LLFLPEEQENYKNLTCFVTVKEKIFGNPYKVRVTAAAGLIRL